MFPFLLGAKMPSFAYHTRNEKKKLVQIARPSLEAVWHNVFICFYCSATPAFNRTPLKLSVSDVIENCKFYESGCSWKGWRKRHYLNDKFEIKILKNVHTRIWIANERMHTGTSPSLQRFSADIRSRSWEELSSRVPSRLYLRMNHFWYHLHFRLHILNFIVKEWTQPSFKHRLPKVPVPLFPTVSLQRQTLKTKAF